MKPPLVSVIMPVFNTSKYLSEAIESILKQTYDNFEFLILDDCSTDDSVSIVKNFSDSRIFLIENASNVGISGTRNKGLDIAKGKYVAIFDSDDIAPPYRLETQVNFFEANPDFGLLGGAVQPIDEKGHHMGEIWKYPAPPEKIPSILLFGNYFAQPAVMLRKEILPDVYYKSEYVTAGDYEFWTRISKITKSWNLPQVMLYYRIHKKGITNRTDISRSMDSIKGILVNQLRDFQCQFSERELEICLAMTNNSYSKGKPKLPGFLNEREFVHEVGRLLGKLKVANNNLKLYNAKYFEVVLNERAQYLTKIFVKNLYLQRQAYSLKVLISFMKSTLRPHQYIGLMEKLKFVAKCLLGYKTTRARISA